MAGSLQGQGSGGKTIFFVFDWNEMNGVYKYIIHDDANIQKFSCAFFRDKFEHFKSFISMRFTSV